MGEVVTKTDLTEIVAKHVYVAVDTSQDWRKGLPSFFRRAGLYKGVWPVVVHYIDSHTGEEVER